MLIELGVVEQRHKAVLEVMGGLPVTEVAGSYGVTRQTVHRWLRWYASGGIAALADSSCRPASCPHRMPPEIEARIVALRTEHPSWGPRTLLHYGKVFTARFGRGKGLVLFDRLCLENGIRHLLTAPRSPTTTGKVERFHKTVRSEFLEGRIFATIEEAQAALDEWVAHYNAERPHQGIGMVAPLRRFELAAPAPEPVAPLEGAAEEPGPELRPLTRLVAGSGKISFEAVSYHVGAWLAGEAVELTLRDGLLEIAHRGVLVACHVHRHVPKAKTPARSAPPRPRPRPAPPLASGPSVTRKVDPTGYVSFAGRGYFVSNRLRGQQVEVRLAAGTVQISQRGVLLKTHVARHDRRKEHGAFSTPQGRPHRTNASHFSREESGTDLPEPRWNAGGGT